LIRDYSRPDSVRVCLISTAWTLQTENGVPGSNARVADRLLAGPEALVAARGRAVDQAGARGRGGAGTALLMLSTVSPVRWFRSRAGGFARRSLYPGDPRSCCLSFAGPRWRRNLADAALADGSRTVPARRLTSWRPGRPAVLVKVVTSSGAPTTSSVASRSEHRRERIFPAAGPSPAARAAPWRRHRGRTGARPTAQMRSGTWLTPGSPIPATSPANATSSLKLDQIGRGAEVTVSGSTLRARLGEVTQPLPDPIGHHSASGPSRALATSRGRCGIVPARGRDTGQLEHLEQLLTLGHPGRRTGCPRR
jgi:hypothetical protein